MAQYEATLFDGGCNVGYEVFAASSMREAIALATEWAREGDWDHPGSVDLHVTGDGQRERRTISVGEGGAQ